MAAYEITVSLRAKDYFYTENNAVSPAAGPFDTFSEALSAFCEAVAFGYEVDKDALNKQLGKYHKSSRDVDVSCRLSLIRHGSESDVTVLENVRSDSDYEGEDAVVACGELNEDELAALSRRGIEPEEDSFGSYFEVYPVNDLLYDLSDAADGALDPMHEDLKPLVKEYARAHDLLTNEIDPAEDGCFCPGVQSPEECFREWGKTYGYTDDEQSIFTDSLVRYPHGYVLEFRD